MAETAFAHPQSYRLKPGEDGKHVTFCRLCEAQCGMVATVKNGRVTKITPDRDHVTAEGHICIKGPSVVHVTYDEDRVTTPLKRSGMPGEFEPVGWDAALDDIACRLRQVNETCGSGSVAVYTGNPSAFATHLPTALLGFAASLSGKIYGAMHVDTIGKQLGSELVYGSPMVQSFPDIERTDFLLMLGANPMVSQLSLVTEPLFRIKLDDIAKRGAVVVVDPRRTETAKRYEHCPIKPDTDVWLLAAMIGTLTREGLVEKELLGERVTGWAELSDALQRVTLAEASERTGIPAGRIESLALEFAAAERAVCYGRVGTNRGTFTTLLNVLIEALNLATGNFGQPGGNVIAGGATDLPTPPYGSSQSRTGIPSTMGISPTGELAYDILTPGEGQLRALIVACGNPALSAPGGAKLEQALESLELLVSIDLYVNETNRYADYILPGLTFLERADTNDFWINKPRPWLQYSNAVIPSVGEARLECGILDDLAVRMGGPSILGGLVGQNEKTHPMDLVAMQFAQRDDGLTLEKLKDHPHGIALAANVDAENSWGRVAFEDGKPKVWGKVVDQEIERLAAHPKPAKGAEELLLFGRRMLKSLNSWMHNVHRLVRSDKPTLLMHPDDAASRGIETGQEVTVSSKSGTVTVTAEVTPDVVAGSVCYPHGWGHNGSWNLANSQAGANINVLASSEPEDWEQVSGACHLDGIPVRVFPST